MRNKKEKIKALDNLLTDILREADEKEREELKKLLWRWKTRILFVDALQEEKDLQTEELEKLWERSKKRVEEK